MKEEYLKSTSYCESDSKAVKEVVNRLTKNGMSNKEKAKVLYKWVRNEIDWRVLPVVGAKEILKREPKRAICVDKTNLLVALCRASGIPARYIFLDAKLKPKKDIPKWTKHAVAEIYLDGEWKIADPAFGEKSKEIMPVNEFGEKSWTKAKNIERKASMSRMFVWFGNLYMKFSPTGRKLKKTIREVKGE